MAINGFPKLPQTQARIDGLMADFSGLENLENVVNKVLDRLRSNVKWGSESLEQFDQNFSEVVRKELGKTLGIVRAKAIQKAKSVPGLSNSDTAYAILRRMYKDELAGNINIAGNRKRISYKKRTYEAGTKKHRHVGARTKSLYEYTGLDRAFVLRFLEFGTDVRTAKTFGPTGRRSTATYGNRGSVGARSFFGSVDADMKRAAESLGISLINYFENWVESIENETK